MNSPWNQAFDLYCRDGVDAAEAAALADQRFCSECGRPRSRCVCARQRSQAAEHRAVRKARRSGANYLRQSEAAVAGLSASRQGILEDLEAVGGRLVAEIDDTMVMEVPCGEA